MTLPLPLENPNGITVKQLREWLALLPLSDEETIVWIEKDGLSNQIISVYPSGKGDVFLGVQDDSESATEGLTMPLDMGDVTLQELTDADLALIARCYGVNYDPPTN